MRSKASLGSLDGGSNVGSVQNDAVSLQSKARMDANQKYRSSNLASMGRRRSTAVQGTFRYSS